MKKIAQITDLHLGEDFPIENGAKPKENLVHILNDVQNRGLKNIVFTGDVGSFEANKEFLAVFNNHNFDLKVILGNHDNYDGVINFYNSNLPENRKELFYYDEDEYYKYIFLDSSKDIISDYQFNWFKENLNTDKKIVVFIHHPILETGIITQKKYPLINSEILSDEIINLDKEIYIFCGHLHTDDIQKVGKVTQFVTPASSYQAKKYSDEPSFKDTSFGYRIINLEESKIDSDVVMFNE